MHIQRPPAHDDDRQLLGLARRRSRKDQRPQVPRPALPREAIRPFRQLMRALLSDDLDTRCRMAVKIQEIGEPQLMQQILSELQAAVRSRNQALREKAATLLCFLGPRLFGQPPNAPSEKEEEHISKRETPST